MTTKGRGLPPFQYRPDLNEIELTSDPSPLRPWERTEKKKDADKKLIKWKLEESSVPVVRNPILKKAIAADPTAGAVYTSTLNQVMYPKLGTAPSEKKAITDAEIQKKLHNQSGAPMWDLIKTHADQPEDKKQVRDIVRKNYKRNPKSTDRDELKYLKAKDRNLDHQFIDTTAKSWVDPVQEIKEEALEKMRAYAFKPPDNSDVNNGIGSFRKTIGRKLRAATSKADWEKSNQRIYEDNSDA